MNSNQRNPLDREWIGICSVLPVDIIGEHKLKRKYTCIWKKELDSTLYLYSFPSAHGTLMGAIDYGIPIDAYDLGDRGIIEMMIFDDVDDRGQIVFASLPSEYLELV